MGILTGVLGLLSTLAALNSFGDTCFANLDSDVDHVSIDKHPGPAFILLLVASVLKIVDIWAHCIVPVPEVDYWTPEGPGDDGDRSRRLLDTPELSQTVA
jgi:hypothetical protein